MALKSDILSHPLFLLLLGTALSTVLIPWWFQKSAEEELLRTKRFELGIEITERSVLISKQLNKVVTTLELNCSDHPDNRLIPTTEVELKKLRQQIADDYSGFNLDAWYWYWPVISRARGLRLDAKKLQELLSRHKEIVLEFSQRLDPVWGRCTRLEPIPSPLPPSQSVIALRKHFDEFEAAQSKAIGRVLGLVYH